MRKRAAPMELSVARSPAEVPAELGSGGEGQAGKGNGGPVSYKLGFVPDSKNLTKEGDRSLAQVAETMNYYPYEKLKIVGSAGAKEPDAQNLALGRAKSVAAILLNKYKVGKDRMRLETKVDAQARPEVEIYIVSGGQ